MGMRKKLIEVLETLFCSAAALDISEYLIANDVVPVVRCKDCKHCNDVSEIPPIADSLKLACAKGVNWRATDPNHFCSYGERREGK